MFGISDNRRTRGRVSWSIPRTAQRSELASCEGYGTAVTWQSAAKWAAVRDASLRIATLLL